ncbi:GntR family transcriptional regulator [Corynebacterium guangdongense]|uniref:GntR family transcriptional regulator n=1 Tax=Corynebacterium guangdongense TaxID=1783348 RepID=A0ABU1ZYW2_9CORY|nr:GntR family transcriptional regulator [Corynebacterium guangdongense]MDR7330121.1 GntR family transcriptional regulator [Corynebacterium guangdongense]WJZ18679.1 HTH-type transcriptional repressor YvoA [Corynebacterium guangdongense]
MEEDRTPAYLSIAASLRERIDSQELLPGDRLPTERDLVDEFGVARMTVRHALDILQLEGLIDRRRGRTGGTFVRVEPPLIELTDMHGLFRQLQESGTTVDSEILLVATESPDPVVAGVLGDGLVHRVLRLRRIDDVPFAIEDSYFPADLFPDFTVRDLTHGLYDLLAELDHRPVTKRETLQPAIADAEEQRRLGVSRTTPLLRLERRASDASGRVVEYSRDILRTDVVKVEIVSRAE